MKIRSAGAVLGLLVLLLAGGEEAAAQRPRTRRAVRATERPAISPYLDLLGRDGTDFSARYFLRVRPEVQWRQQAGLARRSIESLRRDQLKAQRELLRTQRDLRSLTSLLGGTGHSAGFMTHRKYFGAGRGSGF
jgi:hypothetical protein